MFEVLPESQGRRFYIRATGRLTDDDYKELIPRLEGAIDQYGPLWLFVDMEGFLGWELHAAWDDFVFGLKHWNDFERIALVGDKRWEKISAKAMDKLMGGEIRFFDTVERGEARTWIEGTWESPGKHLIV